MDEYIYVTSKNEEDAMELPCEPDGTLLISTLQAQFSKATGLKFKVDSRFRAVRLADDKLYPPAGGWDDTIYFCVFKDDNDGESKSGTKRSHVEMSSTEGRQNTDLVVLGLPWSYTDNDLKQYFEQFGPLEFANVKTDKNSGKSRGFGFIRYTSHESALKAMLKRHQIGNRYCDVRIPESTKSGMDDNVSHKVFVGNLTSDISESDLREHFEQFGTVTDVLIPKPFREFAFVTFETDIQAKSLVGKQYKIKETTVQVTEATPKRARIQDNRNTFDRRNNDRSRSPNNRYGNNSSNYSSGYKKRRSDRDYNDWSGNGSSNGNGPAPVHPDVIQAVVSKAVSEVFNAQKSLDPWGRH